MPPRNRILLEKRQRIIQAFKDVYEDYLTDAATIGVNRSTARSFVARYLGDGRIAERRRGGANHVRVDDGMRNCVNDILNENCLLTLAQITQKLRQRLPRQPAIQEREQQSRGKATRNRFRPFPRSVATSGPTGKHGTIKAAKCGQWYKFVTQTYIPRCLNN